MGTQLTRDDLRQAMLLGVLLADPTRRETVAATEFTDAWSVLVDALLRSDRPNFDAAMIRAVGVERESGQHPIEALTSQVKTDAAWRSEIEADPLAARVARVIDRVRRRARQPATEAGE